MLQGRKRHIISQRVRAQMDESAVPEKVSETLATARGALQALREAFWEVMSEVVQERHSKHSDWAALRPYKVTKSKEPHLTEVGCPSAVSGGAWDGVSGKSNSSRNGGAANGSRTKDSSTSFSLSLDPPLVLNRRLGVRSSPVAVLLFGIERSYKWEVGQL